MTQSVEKLIQEGGVGYFGAMTASVSHEIKNCLAIMNENAGLMTDLILLSQQRPPLDLERIQSITERITGQIHRADTILKNLNVFSHSMDKPVQPVDLSQAVQLAASLGRRISENRRITVQHQPPEKPVEVTAPFFFLLYLIWTILEGALDAMPSGSTLDITCSEKKGLPVISLFSKAVIKPGIEKAMTLTASQHLLTLIPVEVAVDSTTTELIFGLPRPTHNPLP